MHEYPKIETVWLRDPDNRYITLLEGEWATPELEYLKDNIWVFTEKVDGTNIRVMWDGEMMWFGGRTDKAQIPTFLLATLHELFLAEKLAQSFGAEPVCLYGEGYGARIQKGGGNYIPDDTSFILFDVLIDNWWLRRDDVEGIADSLSIDVVPIVATGTLEKAIGIVRHGQASGLREGMAEGLVMKPHVDLWDRAGKRIVAKVKHNDFQR